MTSRSTTAAAVLTALAVVLVMLGAYVAGYYCIADTTVFVDPFEGGRDDVYRIYPNQWLATIYEPAGWIESKVRGAHTYVSYE